MAECQGVPMASIIRQGVELALEELSKETQ